MAKVTPKFYDIKLTPDQLNDRAVILKKLQNTSRKKIKIEDYELIKKSVDARKEQIYFNLRYALKQEKESAILYKKLAPNPKQVIIVGSGPAGLFAALGLIQKGIKPIILERGKDVQTRRRDLKAIQQEGIVNPDSNYCFGEGGAGTYSDGKLYTRSKKRGSVQQILKILVDHGAHPDILIDAHPHIGSNKLPKVVANIRQTILEHGGEIHFDSRVVDFEIEDSEIKAVRTLDGKVYIGDRTILATGHSARDIYYLLDKHGVKLEAKAYAIGIRVEHPQALIDEIQYDQKPRHENLPAASYQLVCQIEKQGVFSFCMCPGGMVVPSATAPGEIVVNGMSLSRRDSAYANSGIVTQIHPDMFESDEVFTGLDFQKEVEQHCFDLGDGSQKAPAQRLTDFVQGIESLSLPDSSYIPGLLSRRVDELFPEEIYSKLSLGLLEFGRKLPGYLTSEAVVIATESRTSSPIRIPRDNQTLQNDQIKGLYPCGEGAGYAGGIVSAAIDGWKISEAISETIVH